MVSLWVNFFVLRLYCVKKIAYCKMDSRLMSTRIARLRYQTIKTCNENENWFPTTLQWDFSSFSFLLSLWRNNISLLNEWVLELTTSELNDGILGKSFTSLFNTFDKENSPRLSNYRFLLTEVTKKYSALFDCFGVGSSGGLGGGVWRGLWNLLCPLPFLSFEWHELQYTSLLLYNSSFSPLGNGGNSSNLHFFQ